MSDENQSNEELEILSKGLNRRGLLKVASAAGVGAALPGWALAPGAIAAPRRVSPRLELPFRGRPGLVLQPGRGLRPGHYIRATPENIRWGHLPNAASEPIATVESGALVTIDTVSHEGVLEDQGRNPIAYFGAHGVPRRAILDDAIAIAESDIAHDFDADGPHLVVGPIRVQGAEPGDVLRIDVLAAEPRVPYGVVSTRHGKGALAGEFPEGLLPDPNASPERPELYNNTSIFFPVRTIGGERRLVMPAGPRHQARFALQPFFGTMGVARNTTERVSSVPPTEAAGNLNIGDLGVGSSL